MTERKTTKTSRQTANKPVADYAAGKGDSNEIRVDVTVGEEKTEYAIVRQGGDDKFEGFNVIPQHDPRGQFLLDESVPTQDEALAAINKMFAKGADITVNGAGDAFVVLNADGKVLACEDTREAAVEASKQLAKDNDDASGSTGSVHPATTAVKQVFASAGTEGTRVILNRGGFVSLAR